MHKPYRSYTTGPLYIDPELRRSGSCFGLMISLFFGSPDVRIRKIELYAAQNTGFNTSEDWKRIYRKGPLNLMDEDMINFIERIPEDYPYFQWIITYERSPQLGGITHALYLLDNDKLPIENIPLVANGDWTVIPSFSL